MWVLFLIITLSFHSFRGVHIPFFVARVLDLGLTSAFALALNLYSLNFNLPEEILTENYFFYYFCT